MIPPEGRVSNLQLQSPAVDFIENSLDKYHPAFSTPPSRFDPSLGGFVLQNQQNMTTTGPGPNMAVAMCNENHSPASGSALAVTAQPGVTTEIDLRVAPRPVPQGVDAHEFWECLFPQGMAYLKQAHPLEPERLVNSRWRIRDKRNWKEVFDQLENAKNIYCKVDSKFKVAFRNVYRKFGEHAAEPLNRMSKLVPAGGELGAVAVTPLIGCVQILLEASRAASKVRKTMVGAFDEVDMMFADVELFLRIYPEDKNIEQASVKLIADTLFAVENVIGFFLKGTGSKFIAATLHRENYEKNTLESLDALKLQCEQLLREADKTHKYQTYYTTNHIMDKTTSIDVGVQSIRREQVRQHDLRNVMRELLDELDLRREEETKRREEETQRREEETKRREEETMRRFARICVDAANAASQSPTPARLAWTQTAPAPAPAPAPNVQHLLGPEDLISCIGIPDILSQDFQHLAEKRKVKVSEPDQARAEQLIRTSQVREWLSSPESSQLLVHGNYDRRAYISGLSLFCMSLAHTLSERAPRFIPLVFFCGLHTEPLQDSPTGGRALIQSFICQLLRQYDFTGDGILIAPEDLDDVEQGDVGTLCRVFERLVRMLPHSVAVFCLVDGVVYYERGEFVHDLERVLMTILQLSDQEGVQAPIKVLLTSPTRTAVVRQPFPDELILSMEGMVRADLVASSSRLGRELSSGME